MQAVRQLQRSIFGRAWASHRAAGPLRSAHLGNQNPYLSHSTESYSYAYSYRLFAPTAIRPFSAPPTPPFGELALSPFGLRPRLPIPMAGPFFLPCYFCTDPAPPDE